MSNSVNITWCIIKYYDVLLNIGVLGKSKQSDKDPGFYSKVEMRQVQIHFPTADFYWVVCY